MHIVINGGGLVGALAAIYMLQHTRSVTVVEKRSDLRKATIETGRSINLIVTSRGLFALRQVGLEEAALKLCVPVEGRMMHTVDGKQVFQPYGISPDEVNYSVSRTALNAMLIEEAERRGARFFFEHELQSLDFDSMCATYKCPSGTLSMKGDMFMGTDGVASTTRSVIIKRLVSEGVPAKDFMERLGISYMELTFPPKVSASGKREYSMEQRGLHIWPRGAHFLMALADKQETFTGTLYLPDGSADLKVPTTGVPTFDELAGKVAKYEEYIKTYYPDVPELVKDYKEQFSSRAHSLLATLRTTHWSYKGKAVVLGDAGHGVVPFFGQGMNLGFESITVLNRFMNQFGCRPDTLEKVFNAYHTFHHASAVAIADMAIENLTEMSYKVSLPEFLKRKQVENTIEAKFPKVFRSRYYMVTKTLIPYALVKAAGPIVDTCVSEILALCDKKKCNVDALTNEEMLDSVNRHVTVFFTKHNIEIGNTLREYYPKKKGGSKL